MKNSKYSEEEIVRVLQNASAPLVPRLSRSRDSPVIIHGGLLLRCLQEWGQTKPNIQDGSSPGEQVSPTRPCYRAPASALFIV